MTDFVAKQACSENAQPSGITYMADCTRIEHRIEDMSIQHKRTGSSKMLFVLKAILELFIQLSNFNNR